MWKSIIWGKELLEADSRRRVGNSCSIQIYKDRWILRPSTFRIVSPSRLEENSTVSQLKTFDSRWNVELIKDNFLEDDVTKILSLQTSINEIEDSILWHFDQHGNYSVRSRYWVGLEPVVSGTDVEVVAKWIVKSTKLDSDVGLVIAYILLLLNNMRCRSVSYVPRKANQVAHLLAKMTLSNSEDYFWMEECPSCVCRTV
ncbi:hypothetical protein Ddye_025614 [Dipteronia dyeriana]|uniref:RNase H type-1 domain-containing protein n=1 Tax=Dipteronia dyeriana TaxID=168575 RepID=A0AAD9TLI0_9ROSI|nr:hypothetical protein Ddye_025614 [Dipteronia dyeriana]